MRRDSTSKSNVNYISEKGIKIIKGIPLVDITKLKLHPNNIKSHPKEQINNLAKLMKMIGFKDPIVVDKNFNVKAGHGRLLAAQQLHMTRVPYIPLKGLTKKQMDLFMYMDNQVNESAPWIDDNLQLLLEDIPTTTLDKFEVDWGEIVITQEEDPKKKKKIAKSSSKKKKPKSNKLGGTLLGKYTICPECDKLHKINGVFDHLSK